MPWAPGESQGCGLAIEKQHEHHDHDAHRYQDHRGDPAPPLELTPEILIEPVPLERNLAQDPPADPTNVGDSFGPYVFRDGYYGFGGISSGTSAYRYSGINTCSVYYVGDPDVMSDTTDA